MNKVIPHINVLRVRMVLVILGKSNGRLIVGEKDCHFGNGLENLFDEGSKPESLLRSVHSGYVLTLGCQERDNLLSL